MNQNRRCRTFCRLETERHRVVQSRHRRQNRHVLHGVVHESSVIKACSMAKQKQGTKKGTLEEKNREITHRGQHE